MSQAPAATPSSFYIWCDACEKIQKGRLRVKCQCDCEAFELENDPLLDDVAQPNTRVKGLCYACDESKLSKFFFKCDSCKSELTTFLPEVGLNPTASVCHVCFEDSVDMLVIHFSRCEHIICVECFPEYARLKIGSNSLVKKENGEWTVCCAIGQCPGSLVNSPKLFKLLDERFRQQYRDFSARNEAIRNMGGVECPIPGCNILFVPGSSLKQVKCIACNGMFCRVCNTTGRCDCAYTPIASQAAAAAPTGREPPLPKSGRVISFNLVVAGKRVEIEADLKDRVYEVKQRLAAERQLDVNSLNLIYCGQTIKDNSVIGELNISAKTLLFLIIKQKANDEEVIDAFREIVTRNEESASDTYVKSVSRPCPSCRAPATHFYQHACHHLHCPCGCEWCFECGSEWSEACEENHFFCTQSCKCPRNCPECQPGRRCELCSGRCDVCVRRQ